MQTFSKAILSVIFLSIIPFSAFAETVVSRSDGGELIRVTLGEDDSASLYGQMKGNGSSQRVFRTAGELLVVSCEQWQPIEGMIPHYCTLTIDLRKKSDQSLVRVTRNWLDIALNDLDSKGLYLSLKGSEAERTAFATGDGVLDLICESYTDLGKKSMYSCNVSFMMK